MVSRSYRDKVCTPVEIIGEQLKLAKKNKNPPPLEAYENYFICSRSWLLCISFRKYIWKSWV
jgi:hypothetical protein